MQHQQWTKHNNILSTHKKCDYDIFKLFIWNVVHMDLRVFHTYKVVGFWVSCGENKESFLI